MLKVQNNHWLVTFITVDRSSRPIVFFLAYLPGQVVIYIKYKRTNTSFLSLINLNANRAQHDTLSKKRIVIFDDNDTTGLDNQVIDRSG